MLPVVKIITAASAAVALVLTSGAQGANAKTRATSYSSPVQYPAFTTGIPVTPSRGCAVDVTPFVDQLPPDSDVTGAFKAAMNAALTQAPNCYRSGPSGSAQAVVYVPAGTYEIANLAFQSNVRLEVDAGAELRLPPDRDQTRFLKVPMISWDGSTQTATPLTNVSVVGVSQAMTDAKQAAETQGGKALSPFDISNSFTMNLDAEATNSTNYGVGINLTNVQYFLVQNVFSIQNATNQVGPTNFAWPTSARPVLEFDARRDSPISGDPATYLEPKYGLIENHVDVDAPRIFGPNQVTGAQHVIFRGIYSQGGTALRLETDGANNRKGVPDRGAIVDDITGQNIVGFDCNRAVSLSPHAQSNGNVSIDGVWSYSCYQAVVARRGTKSSTATIGTFGDVDVENLNAAGGDNAQVDSTTSLWAVGTSTMRVLVSANLGWTPHIVITSSAGRFATPK